MRVACEVLLKLPRMKPDGMYCRCSLLSLLLLARLPPSQLISTTVLQWVAGFCRRNAYATLCRCHLFTAKTSSGFRVRFLTQNSFCMCVCACASFSFGSSSCFSARHLRLGAVVKAIGLLCPGGIPWHWQAFYSLYHA